MTDLLFYTDMQIIGNLINNYMNIKDYKHLKELCSSIQKINHLKDDYRKLISFLSKNNQLTDYLYNFHDKKYDFRYFKNEFKKLNNLKIENSDIIKVFHTNELVKNTNQEDYRLFVKIVGDTKQLSTILNVKKMQIMWIANTPVWFVPYENLRAVLNTAHVNNINIKVEKNGMEFFN